MGCRLVKRQDDGSLPWGVIVETEVYSQDDPACNGYRRRSPQNEILFGEPGQFYVYVSYGMQHGVRHALRSGPQVGRDFSGLAAEQPANRQATASDFIELSSQQTVNG